MTFKNQESRSGSDSAENREQEHWKKQGTYLKGLVALTNGVVSARKQRTPELNFLVASINQARETYKALDGLEKEIDPSGNLSAEIAELTTDGLGRLADWLEAHSGASNERK